MGIKITDFKTVKFCEKSWEAGLFYKNEIPQYLYHNLYEDEVAETEFFLPEKIFEKIKEVSASVSSYYEKTWIIINCRNYLLKT